jgi:hypothetical protein
MHGHAERALASGLLLLVLIGSGTIAQGPDLRRAMDALGVHATAGWDAGVGSGAVLCPTSYPEPIRLSAEEAEGLERLVAGGGRAYVEFAVREDGQPLFGVGCEPDVRRALHQRLAVAEDLEPISGLIRGDLLEEHNSACLRPTSLPEGARVLLEYGPFLGTYRAMEYEPTYAATVDLGKVRTLTEVSQRFGAGQPSYYPEQIELWLGASLDAMERVAVREAPAGPVVRFGLGLVQARYIRLVCRKFRRSPVTDFLFMGEIEALDGQGRNAALGRPYTLTPEPDTTYVDSGGELTDGVVEAGYEDGQSVGWATQPAELWERWPALVEVPWGEGTALVALSSFSDFHAREYRLTRRWEGLLRHVALFLAAPEARDDVEARYVPLEPWTEPRVWAPTRAPVMLQVRTAQRARVTAEVGGSPVRLEEIGPGRYEGELQLRDGEHRVRVRARTQHGRAEALVSVRVSAREVAYRRALDRNLRWFERSGVLPRADGSEGVWSQRCLAWFDGGPIETLASPFRVDCNAATAQALYLYGELPDEDRWRRVGLNVARSMLPHQYRDPARPTFGGWPWLYENDEAIYFWDDNTRVAVALLWLYTQTGDEELLRAGLRTMELCREVAQPDGLIARHVIAASQLDRIGRDGFRQLPPQGVAVDFDLKRWGWAYGVTGDPAYRELLEQAADTWGAEAGIRGLPFAVRGLSEGILRTKLVGQWRRYLQDPSVKRLGAPLAGPGDYGRAFVGDCSITTTAEDPLTDQLYSTPHLLLQALWGWCATGKPDCREAFERIGDYLVRIQQESRDPRVDGAWMRGFDVEHWEVYGAPYDPAYGPYSAYTGWMNAFAASALAQYLLGADALPPSPPLGGRAAEVLAEVRAERPAKPAPTNIAAGARYELGVPPVPAYADSGSELTDGVLDGPYADGRSVGWHLGEDQTLTVEVTLDLGRVRRVAAVAQRYGAGRGDYCPDRTEVWCGTDPERMTQMAVAQREGAGPGRRFIALAAPADARLVRVVLSKRRVSPTTDFLFVGETEAFEER